MNELERAIMTSSCADCADIPKVPDAGRIVDTPQGAAQIMHNGIKVRAGAYNGDWMAQVIRALRGHHEPQEERAFHALLGYCRHRSTIVELGSFWAYYSMWYLAEVPGSRAICIEPDPAHLDVGRGNAALNGLTDRISFHQAFVGAPEDEIGLRTESDGRERSLPRLGMAAVLDLAGGPIELLHMDVQGAELDFLRSIGDLGRERQVRFVVASTHHSSISGSPTTHRDCRAALVELGASILVEHDVQQSFSGDGLLVASFFHEDRWTRLPRISLNEPLRSLFPEP